MITDIKITQDPNDTLRVQDRCNFIGWALDKICVPNDKYILGGLFQVMLNVARSQGYTRAQFAKFLRNMAEMMELEDAETIGRG